MKNLLFGIMMILFMMFGCADIPTEPHIPYQSGEVKSSDRDDKSKDLSVVRLKGEPEIGASQFDANGKRSPNIVNGMKLEIWGTSEYAIPNIKLMFTIPLNKSIDSNSFYHMEIFFLKKKVQAMKLLRRYMPLGEFDPSEDDEISIFLDCFVDGRDLKKDVSLYGQSTQVSCSLDESAQEGTIGAYLKPFTDSQQADIRSFKFKSAIILLHKDVVGDRSSNRLNVNDYSVEDSRRSVFTDGDDVRFGYRCLLNRGASNPHSSKVLENGISDNSAGRVSYHACRYLKKKGGSS